MALVSLVGEPSEAMGAYGLALQLCDEHTEALGLTGIAAGQEITFRAVATATRVTNEVESDDDDTATTLTLQLTAMEVLSTGKAKNHAKTLYGKEGVD